MRPLAAALALLLLLAGALAAQDEEDYGDEPFLYWHDYKPPDPTDELQLAQRDAIERVKAARSGDVISGYQITRHQQRSVGDALPETPAAWIARDSLWQVRPVLRGLGGGRVLLLLDGLTADSMVWPDAAQEELGYLDPQATGRVEVVRGPASALYGSGALGGVVSAETVLRQDFRTNFDFSSGLLGRIDTAAREQFASLAWESNVTDFFGGVGVASFGKLHGLDAGGALDERPGTGLRRSDVSLSFNVPVQGRLQADAVIGLHDIERAGGNPRIQESRRELYRIRARLTDLGDVLHWAEVSGGALLRSRTREQRVSGLGDLADRESALSGQAHAAFSLRFGRFFQTQWGADWIADSYDGRRDGPGETAPPLPDDAGADRLGLYSEFEFTPLVWLHIVPAARGEWQWAEARRAIAGLETRDLSYDEFAHAESVSSVFDLGQDVHLLGRFERGYRLAGLAELAGVENGFGPLVLPAEELQPEELHATEAGLRYDDGKTRLDLSGAWSKIEQGFVLEPAELEGRDEHDGRPLARFTNADELSIWSIESAARFKLGLNWVFSTQLAWAYGQNERTDEPADGVPPLFGSALLHWNSDDDRLTFEPYVDWAAAQRRPGEGDELNPLQGRETAGWISYNARMQLEVTRYIRVLLEGRNLSDLRYRRHGSTEYEPGRSFCATLQLHF